MHPKQARALRLLQYRQRLLDEHREAPSYRSIAQDTGFPTTTLFDWDHKDMSPEAVEERHQRQGAHPLLKRWQQLEVLGYIFYRHIHLKNTAVARVKRYILRRFGVEVDHPWMTRFMKHAHISSQHVISAKIEELSEERIEEFVRTLSEWRTLHVNPAQIATIDKIYLKDTPTASTQLAPIGLFTSSPPQLSCIQPDGSSYPTINVSGR
jgi:hypothetical protein